jgi:hypothetical protein
LRKYKCIRILFDNLAKQYSFVINFLATKSFKHSFKMSKFDEVVAGYAADAKTHGISTSLLTGVAKGLGPSIYNADSSKVSGSDKSELDRVRENFLKKKLGLTKSLWKVEPQ